MRGVVRAGCLAIREVVAGGRGMGTSLKEIAQGASGNEAAIMQTITTGLRMARRLCKRGKYEMRLSSSPLVKSLIEANSAAMKLI